MDFKTWHAEADMPMKRDGVWFDNETGLPFVSDEDIAERAEQRAATAQAAEARQAAKALGGRALVGGSGKQKKWAEELRAGVIEKLKPETAEKVLNQFRDTKWWIDNRDTFSFSRSVGTKKVTEFKGSADMEKVFEKHFDRPRIDAFQKPLREVLEHFESRLNRQSGVALYGIQSSDAALIKECKTVLASDSTDMPTFAALMDRLLARIEQLSR